MILMTYTSAVTPPAVLAAATGREEGYITAALAAVDRRLIFCSDCQEAYACFAAFHDTNAAAAAAAAAAALRTISLTQACPLPTSAALRGQRSLWTGTLALYMVLSTTIEMFMGRVVQRVRS